MKLRFSSRKWHAWISFVLSMPILLVAVTAILIAHGQKLGFRDIKVNPSWLPGYASAAAQREVRATLHAGDTLWIGTQVGLFRQDAAGVNAVSEFERQEVRTILSADNSLFVLTAQGLFSQRGGEWKKISRGPVTSAYIDGGKLYATMRDKGLQVSDDGGARWHPIVEAQTALAALPPLSNMGNEIQLSRLIRDLHTGEALLGHDGEWIWNDILGGTMAFLALTGVYLWWKGQRKMVFSKRTLKNANAL